MENLVIPKDSIITYNISIYIPYLPYDKANKEWIKNLFYERCIGDINYIRFLNKTTEFGENYFSALIYFNYWFQNSITQTIQNHLLSNNCNYRYKFNYDDSEYMIFIKNKKPISEKEINVLKRIENLENRFQEFEFMEKNILELCNNFEEKYNFNLNSYNNNQEQDYIEDFEDNIENPDISKKNSKTIKYLEKEINSIKLEQERMSKYNKEREDFIISIYQEQFQNLRKYIHNLEDKVVESNKSQEIPYLKCSSCKKIIFEETSSKRQPVNPNIICRCSLNKYSSDLYMNYDTNNTNNNSDIIKIEEQLNQLAKYNAISYQVSNLNHNSNSNSNSNIRKIPPPPKTAPPIHKTFIESEFKLRNQATLNIQSSNSSSSNIENYNDFVLRID